MVKRLFAFRAACPLVERLKPPFLAVCFFQSLGSYALFVLRVDPQDMVFMMISMHNGYDV